MAAGQKPVIRMQIVSKADKTKKRYIGAAWVSYDGTGLSGKFEKEIVAIKFSDGTVAKSEDVWFNVYDERMGDRRTSAPRAAQPAASGAGKAAPGDYDDIPF